MEWLYVVAGLLVGSAITWILVVLFYRKGLSKRQKKMQEDILKAESESDKIVGEAQKAAENRKRELLLQAKEEITKAKVELERDVRDRKAELAKERHRIEQKEEVLDKKLDIIDQKESALETRVSDVLAMEERARELEKQKVFELERISGLSVDDARHLVLEQARQEFSHEMAALLKNMEEKTSWWLSAE